MASLNAVYNSPIRSPARLPVELIAHIVSIYCDMRDCHVRVLCSVSRIFAALARPHRFARLSVPVLPEKMWSLSDFLQRELSHQHPLPFGNMIRVLEVPSHAIAIAMSSRFEDKDDFVSHFRLLPRKLFARFSSVYIGFDHR
jgi:hypothetical protein